MAQLLQAARRDPSVMLVVGDLGYGVVDEFARELPGQFLNAGVAEQGMIGVAAGLAKSGYKVVVYSIANFPTLRALEQVRNDVCYHDLDVAIVGVGAGLAYGTLGYTHHAVEDISVMRALPGVRVVSPADATEAVLAATDFLSTGGPTYIRLGRDTKLGLYPNGGISSLNRPLTVRDGESLTMIATGAIVANCAAASDRLRVEGFSIQVLSCPTVSPMDSSWLLSRDPGIPVLSVEEHVLPGGFGSAVLEAASTLAPETRVHRIGLRNSHIRVIGSEQFLRETHGLSVDALVSSARLTLLS